MKKTLSEYDFCREWETNEERKNQFSHGAQKALYNYLVEYEESTGDDVELDIIALCCEYTEYPSAFEAACEYGYNVDMSDAEVMESDTLESDAFEWLEERTTVIPFDYTIALSDGTTIGDKGVIIAQF